MKNIFSRNLHFAQNRQRRIRPQTQPLATIIAVFLLLTTATSNAAPKSELWSRWTEHNATSSQSIDHTLWSEFLQKFVRADDSGMVGVAYQEVSAADHQGLKDYISTLENTPISEFARDEQRAFWINLYNATTVNVVLDAWPVDSIRDIKGGFLSGGPWKAKRLMIENEEISLNDIEHRILRPIWEDPRLHYALNCASIGCPDLLNSAFTGENSETLLEQAAKTFINHPRAATVTDSKLAVSSIYDWFKEDFGGNDDGVITHLRKYAEPDLSQALESVSKLDSHSYDWSINSF